MALATRPKRDSAAHRKRSGKHHRHTDSYRKHYWPYIPMLLIVGLGLVFNSVWSKSDVLGAADNFSASSLLTATNERRAQDNDRPLALNQQLNAAAQAKADDMAARNYWSHDSPDGKTPWAFINGAGYSYKSAGENLAYGFGDAGQVVAGWMNSPSHRANLLGDQYKDVGFGVAQVADFQGQGPTTIVVAEYGTPADTAQPLTVAGTGSPGVPTAAAPTTQPVSRIQLLTDGQAIWSTAIVSALAGAAVALFIVRHGLHFRRMVVAGEHFVTNRPLLDISLVFVGTMAFIFMQASGTIH